MLNTSAISNLIRENKEHMIYSHIQTGAQLGMITLDDHMMGLYEQGQITYETMLEYAMNPEEITKRLSGPTARE